VFDLEYAEVAHAVDRNPAAIQAETARYTTPNLPDLAGTGLGLLGMRERVDAVGGTLRHGRLLDGGSRSPRSFPYVVDDGAHGHARRRLVPAEHIPAGRRIRPRSYHRRPPARMTIELIA